MKYQFNESPRAGQLPDHLQAAIKEYYSWVAKEAILEEWGRYLEAAALERPADGTRRRAF